jgi:D-sedoheptulose 7-phosphate isomerase
MNTIAEDAEVFARGYVQAVTTALQSVDLSIVTRVVEDIWTAYGADRQVFFLGNGGSASTSSHLATDLAKGALGHRGDAPARPVRAISLTDNTSLVTAWANDVGYEHIFLGQLQTQLRRDDVVIGISASGNSPNVLTAIGFAREAGARTIGLAGFGGGALSSVVDIALIVDSNHYGVVEDVHLQVGHIICYYFRQRIAEGGAPGRSIP